MKLCKDCKFHQGSSTNSEWFILKPWAAGRFSKCKKKTPEEFSVVTGKPIKDDLQYCTISRQYTGEKHCGPEAKWFEAKHD